MTIHEQAEYHRLLLVMGIIRREHVIAWADQLLLQSAVPVEVIDISLAVHAKEYELDALLKKVPGEGDLALAAHAALGRLKVLLHDLPLADAVKKIVEYGSTAKVPEEEHQAAILFRDLYDDMLAGYSGSETELWQMLGDFVNRHAHD
jgi:hypothetical protein